LFCYYTKFLNDKDHPPQLVTYVATREDENMAQLFVDKLQ